MARARSLKPGFFANEVLAECSPWARLCFAGLWTLADRDGRLEDRPKRIKGELFRYDDTIDVDELLDELGAHGFLLRYRNGDGRFIQILAFKKHQTPHYSEKESVIKPPDLESAGDDGGELQEDSRSVPGTLQEHSGELHERNPLTSDFGLLTPDSGLLTPPSAATPRVDAARAATTRSRSPPCPTNEIVALWNRHCAPPLRSIGVVNDARRSAIGARWREVCADSGFDRAAGVGWFEWLLRERIAGSDFLTGRTPRNGRNGGTRGRTWRATLDWILDPTNFAKVVDGNYANGGTT